jgi:hypothetical protein
MDHASQDERCMEKFEGCTVIKSSHRVEQAFRPA